MHGSRRIKAQVFGYTIEENHEYDTCGALRAKRYDVYCPQTGVVLGRLQSLRMAKRFVIVHELGDLASQKKQARAWREILAA